MTTTGSLTGADTDALRELATDLAAGATELQQLSAELARTIDAAHSWQGPDATRCKAELGELARTRVTGVADALETAGALLRREAADQDTASGETPAQQRPGLLRQLWTWGTTLWGAKTLVTRIGPLAGFLSRLGPATTFFARTRAAITALASVWKLDEKGVGLLARWAGKIGVDAALAASATRWIARLSLPVTGLLSIPDIVTGGGYTGARGVTTQVLAGLNTLGAGFLVGGAIYAGGAAALVAAAPVAAAAATVAVAAYGAWKVGNAAVDLWQTSPWLREAVRAAPAHVGTALGRAFPVSRAVLDVSQTFARVVLGPAPAGGTR
jgi:uncharacterized protein YukE